MKEFAGCLGLLVLRVGTYIVNGLALKVLWGWFLVQFGLPEIGLAHAIGIGLTAGCLAHQFVKNDAEWDEVVGYQIALPAVAVMVGWIVQLFM